MKPNMGTLDRLLRTGIAVVFAALYFTGTVHGVLGAMLLVLGVVFLLTSAISFCPLYTLFGWRTRKAAQTP